MTGTRFTRIARACVPALIAVLAAVVCSGFASAQADAAAQPWWQLTAITAPADLVPGGEGQIHVTVTNIGDANASVAGEPLTITDNLPAGLEAVENGSKGVEGPLVFPETPDYRAGAVTCTTQPSTVTCTYTSAVPLAPFVPVEVAINVNVAANGAGNNAVNELTASGAGAPPAIVRRPLKVDSSGSAYGIEDYELIAENEGGSADTQAGSHPFQLTTTLGINNRFVTNPSEKVRQTFPKIAYPTALSKDLIVTLPPGLVGNATTLPKCTEAQFTTEIGYTDTCPADSAVGVASATIFEPEATGFINGGGVATAEIPIFNLPPAKGEPARFGFDAYDNFVTLDTSVRTGKDYAVVTDVRNVSEIAPLLASAVTLWGVPGDSRHNEVRGWECLEETISENSHCSSAQAPPETPFLTLPGSCTQPLDSSLLADSWKEPGNRFPDGSIEETDTRWQHAPEPEREAPTLSGCSELPFTPSISAQPETQAGSTPTGLSVDVHLPQPETADSRAEADVKDTTVKLPQGVELSPAASHGLEACTEEEIGYLRQEVLKTTGALTSVFTPTLPSPTCPNGSKVATVKIKTPLLEHELEGSVYLAEPAPNGEEGKNPFGSLVALYIVAEDPFSGVLVKLAGKVSLDANTGQATTTFESTPQTPFEDLKMSFFGGPTASLTTPAYCGTYTTMASFTPWSGIPAVEEGSSFGITSNCTQPGSNLPFGPSLAAGSSSNQAGAFTPFNLSIGNPDGNQPLNNLTMHLPPGIAAMISSVTPCPAAQAFPPNYEAPHCGPESIVGHSVAFSGLGGDPYELPGTVYLTGPYEGAPFGLAVSTHAKAGPFDLGYINVGSTINVDENTAAVTVTSDPFPQFIKGIPSALKRIVVTVERPGNAPFEFNPTNCNQMAITGTLTGAQGGVQGFNQPFQVANCAKLPFKPTLTASTKGNASKANGAEFVVRVASTPGQANIAKTKLQLPLQLPSRLTTIQKACRDTVFEKNPAECDEGSNIGTAIVHTPVFKNPLVGPAYLVSHGNAAFPDVEFVLQGEGVTLILDGQTDIKKGITTSTFNSVPDAPVTTFETILPEGPHSALTSNVPTNKAFNLCGQKLVMPTTITGQNGVVITQQTKIPVGGCAAVKPFKESRATKLARALKKCRKQFKHKKKKRASCEAKARKKYGAKKKSKKKGAKKKK